MGQRGSPAAVGAILAGGLGRRLGGGKAVAELGGRPLIGYAIEAVEGADLEPVVVAKRESRLPPLRCRVLAEPQDPLHPLCGIVAALRQSGGRPVVAIACDMPLLSPRLLSWLAALPERLAVPELEGKLHPFPGRYDPSLLAALEAALAVREPLRRTLAALSPRRVGPDEIAPFGPTDVLAFNVNTPADLEWASRRIGETRR